MYREFKNKEEMPGRGAQSARVGEMRPWQQTEGEVQAKWFQLCESRRDEGRGWAVGEHLLVEKGRGSQSLMCLSDFRKDRMMKLLCSAIELTQELRLEEGDSIWKMLGTTWVKGKGMAREVVENSRERGVVGQVSLVI